jgi:hypothetical protein
MTVRNKYVVFALLLVSSLITNAQTRNSISNDSVPPAIDGDSIRNPSASSNSDYSKAYEIALKRKEELTNRKAILNDSIKNWKKELKKLEGLHGSIVKSNEKMEKKIDEVKIEEQKKGVPELIKKRDKLLKTIIAEEKEKVILESQLHEINSKLNARNNQRESLGKIKDNVSNQIIAENKDYLERSFSEMNLSELREIKSKCQKYATDAKVNAFVAKVDNVIRNKELYDNMVNVVNASYKKFDVDRALASVTQIKGANTQQQKEIIELKTQMTLFPEGLSTFKEFISELNRMRNGVEKYSMEWYETDSKTILSKNNLGNRIESKLKRVPYLNKKFEEFMNAFKAAPSKHSNVEIEILNQ